MLRGYARKGLHGQLRPGAPDSKKSGNMGRVRCMLFFYSSLGGGVF